MKKIVLMLLFSSGIYAQQQVYNVQRYCVDEKPFTANGCDISGNEYSFVFADPGKKEVTLFLSDLKLQYRIQATQETSNGLVYKLQNEQGDVEMKINKTRNKIEFLSESRRIYLTVGKSTKL